VQLTQAQQVYQLYNQGQTVSQIALSLRLTAEAVNLDLGITGSGG
jgi:DNA-binding NarL/FixJ family response regulator